MGKFITTKEACGTPVVVAVAGHINFRMG